MKPSDTFAPRREDAQNGQTFPRSWLPGPSSPIFSQLAILKSRHRARASSTRVAATGELAAVRRLLRLRPPKLDAGRPRLSERPADDVRVLATVLFTDVVDSTGHLAQLGDHRWLDVLHAHDVGIRAELAPFNGHEVKSTGDGFLATFDRPGRAIRASLAIVCAP